MTEPQVWTLIGVFATAIFAMMGLMTGAITRVVRSEVGGLRSEVGGLRNEMTVRFEGVAAEFAAVHRRLDGLDRDVQALTSRVFDRPE